MFNINIVRESMEEQLNETDQSQKINTGRWQWDPVNRQMTKTILWNILMILY